MREKGNTFYRLLDFIITVIVMLRFHTGSIRFAVYLGGDQLMDAIGFFAHPAHFHFEQFVFHFIVHLKNTARKREIFRSLRRKKNDEKILYICK